MVGGQLEDTRGHSLDPNCVHGKLLCVIGCRHTRLNVLWVLSLQKRLLHADYFVPHFVADENGLHVRVAAGGRARAPESCALAAVHAPRPHFLACGLLQATKEHPFRGHLTLQGRHRPHSPPPPPPGPNR